MRRRVPALLLLCAVGCVPAPHKAALRGDTSRVLELAARKGGLEACGGGCTGDVRTTTLLGCAAIGGNVETMKALLERGADVDGKACGMPPLVLAVERHWHDAARLLLENGADVERSGDRPRVPPRMQWYDVEMARILLDAGADLSSPGRCYWNFKEVTPAECLRFSSYAPHLEAARFIEQVYSPESKRKRALERRLASCRPKLKEAEAAADRAAGAGEAGRAFAGYLAAYAACPEGSERERAFAKLLDVARLMRPAPEVPEQALNHAERAQAFIKFARDAAGFAKAAAEYQMAAELAPWWAEAYFNQGLAREKAGDPRGAAESFKRFLKAAPGAPEAEDVRRKLVELEVVQELAPR
ncbi:ankyrin repeat domain-containing protein [bacterium]|nr:MAG: ankyrin repeat domain-containing protein [bacterium]